MASFDLSILEKTRPRDTSDLLGLQVELAPADRLLYWHGYAHYAGTLPEEALQTDCFDEGLLSPYLDCLYSYYGASDDGLMVRWSQVTMGQACPLCYGYPAKERALLEMCAYVEAQIPKLREQGGAVPLEPPYSIYLLMSSLGLVGPGAWLGLAQEDAELVVALIVQLATVKPPLPDYMHPTARKLYARLTRRDAESSGSIVEQLSFRLYHGLIHACSAGSLYGEKEFTTRAPALTERHAFLCGHYEVYNEMLELQRKKMPDEDVELIAQWDRVEILGTSLGSDKRLRERAEHWERVLGRKYRLTAIMRYLHSEDADQEASLPEDPCFYCCRS